MKQVICKAAAFGIVMLAPVAVLAGEDTGYWSECQVMSNVSTSPTNGSAWPDSCNSATLDSSPSISNCKTYGYSCAWLRVTRTNKLRFKTCTACNDGYELTSRTFTSGNSQGCSLTYHTCTKKVGTACSASNPCAPSAWAPIGGGYQQQTQYMCATGKCTVAATIYRCDAGYYGNNGKTSKSGCTVCPGGGTTAPGDAETVNKCYISCDNGSDKSGTFVHTSPKAYYE